MANEVTDVPDRRRYEVRVDGELAGYAEYILTEGLMTFTHTEIEPAFEGRGLGSVLTREALDDVRARELAVLPLCPFVKGWIQRHRDYADLVYQ
jgi:predicted GNAT family acetyltransferase